MQLDFMFGQLMGQVRMSSIEDPQKNQELPLPVACVLGFGVRGFSLTGRVTAAQNDR